MCESGLVLGTDVLEPFNTESLKPDNTSIGSSSSDQPIPSLTSYSSTPSGSVLDKIQDLVESELYGKSRAIMLRQKDSMIDNSESSASRRFKQNFWEPNHANLA